MHHERSGAHDPLKGSRIITGAILLAGFVVLGTGVGLAVQQPGIALITAAGAWLTVVAVIRMRRGL